MFRDELIEWAQKLADDEPVFPIRGADILGPDTVSDWIQRAELMGVNKGKIADATRVADVMSEWQKRNEYKIPD